MRKKGILWVGVCALLIAVFFLVPNKTPPPSNPSSPFEPISESSLNEPVEDEKPSLAKIEESIESIQDPKLLRNYGTEDSSIKDDLNLVNNVMQRFWLLYKNPDLLRVGSNEEILQSLTGSNPDGIQFISPENDFIDAQGRLTDRWGTPLFFHPESLTRIEIRSAGPDQTLFTEDDTVTGAASKVPLH